VLKTLGCDYAETRPFIRFLSPSMKKKSSEWAYSLDLRLAI